MLSNILNSIITLLNNFKRQFNLSNMTYISDWEILSLVTQTIL